jgi:hypothetical protein
MKKNQFLIPILIIVLAALVIGYFYTKKPEKKKVDKPKEKTEIQLIETDFNANTFSGTTEIELLKELGVCDSTAPNDNNLDRPSCSPRFFRFFNYKKNAELRNNFILLVRSGVNGFPARRLLIFVRENGELVKTNGFIGYIIEKRRIKNKLHDDIVIRFYEKYYEQKYFYNCLFSWKNQRYEFVKCEAINDIAIKPEVVDSVSIEINKTLIEKQLVF